MRSEEEIKEMLENIEYKFMYSKISVELNSPTFRKGVKWALRWILKED